VPNNPLISVIVASWNVADTINRCIDSVSRQTYHCKELIIIDGNSKDGTVEILKSRYDDIIYWESKPDRGVYHAWNKALKHARGEWITFLGADDYLVDCTILDKLIDVARGRDINLIASRLRLVDENGRMLTAIGEPWSSEKIKCYMNIAHPGLLHHKTLFENYGMFDEQYRVAGDYEFILRVAEHIKAAFLDDFTVCMQRGGLSRSCIKTVLSETKEIQSLNDGIGPIKAWRNYMVASFKAKVRKILCEY